MELQQQLLDQLSHIQSPIDHHILRAARERLQSDTNIIRDTSPADHFCAMFIPFDPTSKQVFLVHHKKANSWMVPGGHIDPNEFPVETVKRECIEELGYDVSKDRIELLDVTRIEIENKKQTCKVHWDFWYVVHTGKQQFKVEEREFYTSGWFALEEAVEKVSVPAYKEIMQKFAIITEAS